MTKICSFYFYHFLSVFLSCVTFISESNGCEIYGLVLLHESRTCPSPQGLFQGLLQCFFYFYKTSWPIQIGWIALTFAMEFRTNAQR